MEFISGVLFSASFFGIGYCCYKLGQKSKRPAATQVDEEGQKKAEKMRQGFEQLMNYDVDVAMGRRKVNN